MIEKIVKYFPITFGLLIAYKCLNIFFDFSNYRILDWAFWGHFFLWVLYCIESEWIEEENRIVDRVIKKLRDS